MKILRRVIKTTAYQGKPIKFVENVSSLSSSRFFVNKNRSTLIRSYFWSQYLQSIYYNDGWLPDCKTAPLRYRKLQQSQIRSRGHRKTHLRSSFCHLTSSCNQRPTIAMYFSCYIVNTQLAGAVVLSRVLSEMYFKWDEEILA